MMAAAQIEPPHNAEPAPNILIVEDHDVSRDVLRFLLEHEGHAIAEAVNGLDALGRWDTLGLTVELILLDVLMPGMNGLELMEHLGNRAKVPVGVIGVSAWIESRRLLALGSEHVLALDYLMKPIDQRTLSVAVARALATVRGRRLGRTLPVIGSGDSRSRSER